MTARILVVDDVAANVRLLEAQLMAEYFDVRTASNGREALATAEKERFDLILLDVMMPDMTGFEVCKALKANPRTANIPVVMVTSLDQAEDRVKGLESGADDFLTKPIVPTALMARVKSLVRLKMVTDELELRAATMQSVGINPAETFTDSSELSGSVLAVDDRESTQNRILRALVPPLEVEVTADPVDAIAQAGSRDFDLLMVSLSLKTGDGLRLCTQIKAIDRLRQTPVLLITDSDETAQVVRALDLGVMNDYIMRPIDENELRARVRTQLRRKRYQEQLRNMVSSAVELAITDPLTGLYNRRYLDAHLASAVARAGATEKPVCVLVLDVDHFKAVNDRYGHDAGDDVLREVAERLRRGVRNIDLVARYGGEEFLLVMPETDAPFAAAVAERLRGEVQQLPFRTRSGAFPVTISIGIAEWQGPADTAEMLIKRADNALYDAKKAGRNRVVASAA